ncbi:MAG TPA: twin-arginine translocation signal domain-containing protein, partial [Bryobacteraceae bacterium]|nr:twin-arginine translocation signal domain-containing protein [Bryobacteraceae bacterium]
MNRRDFLQTAAAGALAASAQAAPPPAKMIGLQVGAVSFLDEGVEKALDEMQRDGCVNTLFVATFTYGRGIAGRQSPGQPLPDHGRQEYDTAGNANAFHGGSYTRIHPQYYRNTVLTDFRAPELGDFDVLEAVIPLARKRGMKIICWFEDVWRRDVPNVDQAQEKQLDGRNSVNLCFNNPNYRNWLLGTVEDYARSYEIDGIMWGSERQGAFAQALGAAHESTPRDPATLGCFCSFCERQAKDRGIDVVRARAGFHALGDFVTAARQAQRPVDGYYVTLWRLILRYPELLAWEMLWTDSLRETYAAMYNKVKSVKASIGVGWHIWHNNSFSPIYRAEQDLAELSKYSDFLKMVMYHNCGGERMATYIGSVGRT